MAVLNSQKSNDSVANSIPMSQVNEIHLDEVKLETTAADGVNVTREYTKKKQPDNVGSMKGTNGKASKFRDRAYSSRSDVSSMSGGKDVCRICHLEHYVAGNKVEELIYPCACLYGGVHQSCIYKWAKKMKANVCEVCDQKFDPNFVPHIKQPYINWTFVPSYTRRRSLIASVILIFLVAITAITSYLLWNALTQDRNIKDNIHIVWPLVAVVSICGMGLICFATWFFVFCRETVKEYSTASNKHRRRIAEA